MGSIGAYMKAPWQWILKEIIFEINLVFFAQLCQEAKQEQIIYCFAFTQKKSAIMFKKS